VKDYRNDRSANRAIEFIDKLARKAYEPFRDKGDTDFPDDAPCGGHYINNNNERITSLQELIITSSGNFRAGLMQGIRFLQRAESLPTPPGNVVDIVNSNFSAFEFEKLCDILMSDSVVSVSDAMIKTTAFLQTLTSSVEFGKKRYLFRGQSNINYALIPRLGRVLAENIKTGSVTPPTNLLTATPEELNALTSFQSTWPSSSADDLDIHTVSSYSSTDAAWWVLMQHYADDYGNGTRMLDVTSSLLFALLFACVSWTDGTINTDTDGIVYMFYESGNFQVFDYLDTNSPQAAQFFDTQHEVPKMLFNPPHNERSKAQGGGFIWWPKFWEPLNTNLYYLRIPGDNKLHIAKELLAFGVGPKEAVRGDIGLRNEENLRSIL